MPRQLSDDVVAEMARQQAGLDLTDEQVMLQAQQQATHDALAQGPPQGGAPAPATAPPGPDFNQQYIRPNILPTGLGIAGGVAGTALGGPWGGIVGSGVGSGVGEGINQLTGITEPSLTNLATATGVPMAVGGALQLAKPLLPLMRAGKAAQVLNALAPEEAAAKLATMSPRVPSSTLFKQATESNVKIPMARTLHAIDDMLDDLTNVSSGVQSSNRQVIHYLKGLKNQLTTNPQGLSPQALQRELEGAGHVVKSVATKGGTGSGSVKQVFKHMINDLDDAAKLANPAQPGARALVSARDAFKRESVLKEIGEAITDATKVMRGQGEFVQFNPAAVLREIGKNKFYKEALSAGERSEVEGLLKLLNKIPALRPGAGAMFGAGKAAQLAGGGAIGGTIGAFQGERPDFGTIVAGAAVGAGATSVAAFGRNVATALQMQTGRALMKELLTQSKGVATPQVASILAAYADAVRRGQVAE